MTSTLRYCITLGLAAPLLLGVQAESAGGLDELDCPELPQHLRARYAFEWRTADGQFKEHTPVLIREPGRVVHVYPERGIADSWTRTANGRVALTRYFDDYARAIEYQPADLGKSAGPGNWTALQEVIDLRPFEDQLTEASDDSSPARNVTASIATGEGSLVEVLYSRSCGVLQQVNNAGVAARSSLRLLTLETGAAATDDALAQRANYPSTDYADIGDSENDPFFRKMIALGFIGHGGGFYDDAGRSLGGDHGH